MDRIGVVGINWKQGGPEALARFTVPMEERQERLPAIARQIHAEELVYLATCNRVEVAFVSDGETPLASYRPRLFEALCGRSPQPGEAERAMRAWAGEGVAEHLFLVAAGLDSAKIGEKEISGQVRLALDRSRAVGLVGPRLGRVFETALKVAKKVHTITGVSTGRTSLAEIALDHARARLAEAPGPVAFIGVAPMTSRCARGLAGTGTPLLVVNRTLSRAEALAEEVGGKSISLDDFRHDPQPVEVIITSTAAPEPILSRRVLETLCKRAPSGKPPVVVDLAVPPDIDPADALALGMVRVGMKEIIADAEKNREKRLLEMADAREVVDEALIGLRRRMSERLMAPMIAELRRRYLDQALGELDGFFRKSKLEEAQLVRVRRWTEVLVNRLALVPSAGLRSLAFEVGPQAVDAFFSGLDERLARDLREAAEQTGSLPVPEYEDE